MFQSPRLVTALFALQLAGACNTPAATAPATSAGSTPEAPGTGSSALPVVAPGSDVAAEPEPPPPPPEPPAPVYNAAGSFEPLNELTRALVWGTPEDPVPEVLNATREDLENRHYLYCDELHLELFYPQLRDVGGAYMGVGSDQAYTFIGWMRPQLAWLTDYDPWIRELHRAYQAFFRAAETPEAFREYWRSENRDSSQGLLEQTFANDPNRELLITVFRTAQSVVSRRLGRIATLGREHSIPTFVSDPETYAFVRSLVEAGRVRPLLGNLLDETALREIGRVSRELNVPVRAIYMSNAESYWSYPDSFRENMYAQYFDENSWIVRTIATKPRNGDYMYNLQDALNFQEWLRQPYVQRVRDVYAGEYIRDPAQIPFEVLDAPPFDRD